MANTRTQKPITMAKTKSENIASWFMNEAHWKLLSEQLELGKTAVFKYKKNVKEISESKSAFDALAEIFTVKQLNTVIAMFNDYIEHPEKYEKTKKKAEVDLEQQEEIVQKHINSMNTDYLKYKNESKRTKTSDNKGQS